MENIVAPLLKLTEQIAPFQGGHNKICRRLKHIGSIFDGLHRRIVHAVKSDNLIAVIERHYHKRMNILSF